MFSRFQPCYKRDVIATSRKRTTSEHALFFPFQCFLFFRGFNPGPCHYNETAPRRHAGRTLTSLPTPQLRAANKLCWGSFGPEVFFFSCSFSYLRLILSYTSKLLQQRLRDGRHHRCEPQTNHVPSRGSFGSEVIIFSPISN